MPGRSAGAVRDGEKIAAALAGERLDAAVAAIRQALPSLGTGSRASGAASCVPSGVPGNAQSGAGCVVATAWSPRAQRSPTITARYDPPSCALDRQTLLRYEPGR